MKHLAGLMAVLFVLSGPAQALVVKPGSLKRVVLKAPSEVRAGQPFSVLVELYDAHDNLITDYAQRGRDLEVLATGSAKLSSRLLRKEAFVAGKATLGVLDERAERLVITVRELGGTSVLASAQVRVLPAVLQGFQLLGPSEVRAGEVFELQLRALDAYGNIVRQGLKPQELSLSFSGSTEPQVLQGPTLAEGVGLLRLQALKVGSFRAMLRHAQGATGQSPVVKVLPSRPAALKATAPEEAVAGEPFEVRLTVLDAYGNVVEPYRGELQVQASMGIVSPRRIPAEAFGQGSAKVSLTCQKAGRVEITLADRERPGLRASFSLRVSPAQAEHFVVKTPQEVVAGEPFRLEVRAYDRFGNLVTDYHLRGGPVGLRASGTGRLSPAVLMPGEFSQGVATVEVSYDRAEAITITAFALQKAPAVKEVKERPKAKAPKKVAKKAAKAPKRRPEKKAPKQVARKAPHSLALLGMAFTEAAEEAVLSLQFSSPTRALKVKDSIISELGRDWLRLLLSPARSRLKRTPRVDSSILGAVRVRELPQGELEVLLELLPERVSYKLRRQDSLLRVQLRRL